jgi:GNAT superfamily N-acetyltransferase
MTHSTTGDVEYRMKPPLTEEQLEPLFREGFVESDVQGYARVLERSLTWVGAFHNGELIGFVNLAWDGKEHAFLLDAVVRERVRNRGVGIQMVRRAIAAAREAGVRWVHVDYEPHLDGFWARAGMLPTRARVLYLGTGAR